MGEAYWDVVPELAGTPAQDVALKTHYGVGGNEEALKSLDFLAESSVKMC